MVGGSKRPWSHLGGCARKLLAGATEPVVGDDIAKHVPTVNKPTRRLVLVVRKNLCQVDGSNAK